MTPKPTSTETVTPYQWGNRCAGWHLMRSATLSIIEERMPPDTREVRHWHARAAQFFYVLAGTLTLEVEGAVHRLGPRAGIQIDQGIAHQVMNETNGDVEFLVISNPPAQGDRIEAEKAWLGTIVP